MLESLKLNEKVQYPNFAEELSRPFMPQGERIGGAISEFGNKEKPKKRGQVL
jgi:hypothetical protein